MCFVCGRDNPIGLHLHFYEDEENRVHADCTPRPEHQGYPGVMHGGLVTALLDETIGRTAIAADWWCVTARLEVKFIKPVPVDSNLHLVGQVISQSGRLLRGRAEIQLPDGTVAASAQGTFFRLSPEQVNGYRGALDWWRIDE